MESKTNHDATKTPDTDRARESMSDDLFIGPDPFIAEQEEAEIVDQEAALGEELFANGCSAPNRKKRGRGRPSLEEIKRRKVRERVRAFRARQVSGIQKKWQENLAALSPEERSRLLNQQKEMFCLQSLMNDVIDGVGYGNGRGAAGDGQMPYPDLLYLEVKEFLTTNSLVDSWAPDSVAPELTAEDWSMFDDEPYRQFGLRVHLVRLFYREFIANVFLWCGQNPEEVELGVAEEVTTLLADLSPKETKRLPEPPMPFVSENAREKAILDKQTAEEYRQKEIATFEHWQLRKLGPIEGTSINKEESC